MESNKKRYRQNKSNGYTNRSNTLAEIRFEISRRLFYKHHPIGSHKLFN